MEHQKPLRVTPLQGALLALLILSALINYVDRQATSVVAPLLKQDFHLTDELWGWVAAAFALTYVAAAALGGLWIDRVGVRRGLLFSTLFWTLAAAGHALATGFGSLCAWRSALAIGEGPGGASLLKGVRRVLPPRLQDTGTSLIGAGTLLGAILSALLVTPMAAKIGWRSAFLVTAALGLLWLPAWLLLAGRPGANLEVKGSEPAADTGPTKERLDYRSFAVWATAFAIFFVIPPTVFTLSFTALYLTKNCGVPMAQLGGLQWQPYLAMDLGQLLGGGVLLVLLRKGWAFLSARRLVMVAGFLGSTTMVQMASATDVDGVMFWMNLSRFSFQFAYAGLLAYGITCVPERQAGAMNGFMNATFGLCNFVFSPLIGKIADVYQGDYRPVIWMVGLSPLVGLGGWLVLSRLHQKTSTERSPVEGAEPAPAQP